MYAPMGLAISRVHLVCRSIFLRTLGRMGASEPSDIRPPPNELMDREPLCRELVLL